MKRLANLAPLLLLGCSQIYGSSAPVGCDAEDEDGDGFLSEACLGVGAERADCDDRDDSVYPGAPELCNGVDDDCDRGVDEGLTTALFFEDCDGDGAGANGRFVGACDAGRIGTPSCEGGAWVASGGDCDDGDDAIGPGATETCDGVDQDCDGRFDEGLPIATWYPDCDGDGDGDRDRSVAVCDGAVLAGAACGASTGPWVASGGDCDDGDDAVSPDATEVCNGVDDDCDGRVDDGLVFTTHYPDCDGDGAGDPGRTLESCDVAMDAAPTCASGAGTWVTAAGDCDDADPLRVATCEACGSMDLLFVVDDTESMAAVQGLLAAQLPALVGGLTDGDADLDGTADTEPVTDLHVGVITTDMGARGYGTFSDGLPAPGCNDEPNFGDDGILQTGSCVGSGPNFLSFAPGGDAAQLATDTVCVASVGTDGCLYEMPLEATLRALTPSWSPLRFHPVPAGLGHADYRNAGFARDDAVLVLTMLTDEDDCSVAPGEESLFEGFGDYPPDVECALSADFRLNPVSRYTSGLLALRPARDVVYAALAGVPTDVVVTTPSDADYAAILNDGRMTPTVGELVPGIEPSCTNGEPVTALPPRRLVSLGRELGQRGAATVLGSVCAPDLAAPVAAIVAAALDARDRRCGLR